MRGEGEPEGKGVKGWGEKKRERKGEGMERKGEKGRERREGKVLGLEVIYLFSRHHVH